ncbi:hypothetical protein THRCLA_08081 [Thraustotheca clavata]|uniref:Uncharacterized protein n=1 Tax=Thraustotheca clavata TaxID=74557 RepID=A0A1V9ZA15_9STRA|nr:hypothetical protein THRCLA_08081 [Thraustotheca clavata]
MSSNTDTTSGPPDLHYVDEKKAPADEKKFTRTNVTVYVVFLSWALININSLLDPIKTLYGYYVFMDSYNQHGVWQLTVTNNFNNQSSRVCNETGPFLDCYYELPVYGTGSLAGSICRSYYPIDKGAFQHVGNFFGNCTLPNGQLITIPDSHNYASTQWSAQTSSHDKLCLDYLGEGSSFTCDSYTTMNGRVINHRISQTESSKWCKEFGGYYILNLHTNVQEVLIANVSNPNHPVFTSIKLEYNQPVFSLQPLIGCGADLHIGGAATHITTSAWYGDTTAPWTALTTRTANTNSISKNGSLYYVSTSHYSEGDLTQIHLGYKDAFRLALLGTITYHRVSSIYYPMWLAYLRCHQPLIQWLSRRHMGLVLHKRERRNLLILLFLSLEAIASTEDIVTYCQQVIYAGNSMFNMALKYMSITRIIWPCAFLLLLISRIVQLTLGPKYTFAMSEDLFLLGAPVVLGYIPLKVTNQGMELFQGYRWTGNYIRHYTNSIYNVYTKQVNCFTLYIQLFGLFTVLSPATTIFVDTIWRSYTHHSSIMVYMLTSRRQSTLQRVLDTAKMKMTLEYVLTNSNEGIVPEIARQITKAKLPRTHYCESINLAAEGLICLVYDSIHVVGMVNWGAPPKNEKKYTHSNALTFVVFVAWALININSFLDPVKTLYGYYMYMDSYNQYVVWQLTVSNNFNNQTSRVCNDTGPFLDCYYELPVYGTGSLAGSICRSYYPIDKGPFQHVGNFFGNCTFPNGQRIYIPDEQTYATTQWSVQTSSQDKACLNYLGEGVSFTCDSFTTMNGRVINHRISQTESNKWCKEFGGYYILNRMTNIQEVLIVNISNPSHPTFTSIALDYIPPVLSLEPLIGCGANLHIGGTATHITTSAWYGDTTAPWTARTTRTADTNTITKNESLYYVSTSHYSEGDLTQIRLEYKDAFRLILLCTITYYRFSSIYYPMWLSYLRARHPFIKWISRRHMGLVLHKRERRNLLILFLLSLEAIASTEDIVMYCQQVIYAGNSMFIMALKYMSITRIIWPCAFLLLLFSRITEWSAGPEYSFAMSEDLFLLGAPVVWGYIPMKVTNQGMELFQGYRWTGNYIRHYTNSIYNVYTKQLSCLTLYIQLFGLFTIISLITTLFIDTMWRSYTHHSSIMVYVLNPRRQSHAKRIADLAKVQTTLEYVLVHATEGIVPDIASQITRAKLPRTHYCESMNLAAEGLVCLVYGPIHVAGIINWGVAHPIENDLGHIAVIDGNSVSFRANVSINTLAQITSKPAYLGIPDLS